MADLRSIFRRNVPVSHSIRVMAVGGDEVIGQVMDINQKGFRLSTGRKFKPGEMLQGMIEYSADSAMPRRIQLTAQCIWSEAKETGFSIKEIPIAEEDALDKLVDLASGLG